MFGIIDGIAGWLGGHLGCYQSQTIHAHATAAPTDPVESMACLRRGDVLLVEGQTRVGVAIQYLTQSTAAMECAPSAWTSSRRCTAACWPSAAAAGCPEAP
jgi:hypothetical protein